MVFHTGNAYFSETVVVAFNTSRGVRKVVLAIKTISQILKVVVVFIAFGRISDMAMAVYNGVGQRTPVVLTDPSPDLMKEM